MKDFPIEEIFLQYSEYPTPANFFKKNLNPTTNYQKQFALRLRRDMAKMGLEFSVVSYDGCVYARFPGTLKGYVGFIAHMDMIADSGYDEVEAKIIDYKGGDIPLNDKETIKADECPALKNYIGKQLIVGDGENLLAADNKAGITEIIGMLLYYHDHPEIEHKSIAVCFTHDKTIGRSMVKFDKDKFPAKEAYCIDGGTIGQIFDESMYSAMVKCFFLGKTGNFDHDPKRAVNSATCLADFIAAIPKSERPDTATGRDGYYHIYTYHTDDAVSELTFYIRDFDKDGLQKRKDFILSLADEFNEKYGKDTVAVEMADTFINVKDCKKKNDYLTENAKNAMIKAGLAPTVKPLRGVCDGSGLAKNNIPCVVLSAGVENFRTVKEFISVESLQTMKQVLINLTSGE